MNNTEKIVNLYTESNPNPNSLKFVANFMLVEPGQSFDFPDIQSTQNAPLAEALFNFPFVTRVFYMSNFVTVTKVDQVEWMDIQDELKSFIKNWLEEDKPLLTEQIAERSNPSSEISKDTNRTEMDIKIKGLLDEYVRPAVEQDGGAIEYHSFQDGVVKVMLQGSCSGCPSAMVTLKSGIENLLKAMVPEVERVEAEEI
jgi:Fe-S cluster biogenesis protein NfuA